MKVIVQEYGLDAFAKRIVDLASDGYELDMQTNDGYPKQIGVVYTAIMLKDESDLKEETAPVKRTRKVG